LLRFWINGVETPVIIDDYLPTVKGKLTFAKAKDDELWVCLLEKAWAKLHGSYERPEGGYPHHAGVHMMGVPSTKIIHKDLD